MNKESQKFQEIEDFDIIGIIKRYLRYWPWFLLSLFVCYGIGYVFIRYATPIFQVSASLMLKDEQRGFTPDSKVLEELNLGGGSSLVENEIEILHARSLADKVIKNLELDVSYWHEGRVRDIEMYPDSPIKVVNKSLTPYAYGNHLYIEQIDNNKFQLLDNEKTALGRFGYGDKINSKYGVFSIKKNHDSTNSPISNAQLTKVQFEKKENLTGQLSGGIKTQIVNEFGTVIKLSFEHTSGEKAIKILDNFLNEYAKAEMEDKNKEVANTLRFIEGRLTILNGELVAVEQNVEQYRKNTGISDLSEEATSYLEKATQNDTKLNEIDIQLKVLDNIEKSINNSELSNLSIGTNILNDPLITSYISQLSALELQREAMAKSATKNNPYLQTIESQQSSLKLAIKQSLKNQRANINIGKRNFEKINHQLSSGINAIPTKERKFVSIKRQADTKANLYLLLLEKREEAALSIASTVIDSRVIDRPYVTGSSIRPSERNVKLVSILLGILIPFGILQLLDLLNNTIKSKKSIEEKTGKNIFAEISQKLKPTESPILEINSRSMISEQFRMLRSNTNFLLDHTDTHGKVFMVTSSIANEGKSFVAANMATFFGSLDKKVIVLGLDMRMPKIAETFEVDSLKGISNYLIGQAELPEIIQTTKYQNVSIIAAGTIPPNPSELISKPKLAQMFEQLKLEYDYIIVDTPPIGIVSDALELAPYIDVCFYLVRYGKTPKSLLALIKSLENRKIFKSIQIIFNGVDTKEVGGFAYGYGYGYGKGYYGE